MPFMEDFEKTAKKMLKEAEHAAANALKAAGEMTEANRDKIDSALDRAGRFVDGKTEGKYAAQVAKAKTAAGKGVDFVAAQKGTRVPPRPGHAGAPQSGTTGPVAGWQDTSDVQDRVGGAQHQQGGQDATYPSPIPPYTPPTQQ